MAGGYLGKISAVISANTGDYVRKLSESAKETQSFAKTVESTLRRASSDAAKSLQSIYTPLQQFERALRAAASEKLSFKGFNGAIRTVEELKRRLGDIKASDVDIVVKASGQKTLTDLRNVINDISSRDIDLFRNVGGLAGLQKARAEIEALSQRTDIVVKPKVSLAELDRLIAKFSQIDDTQINAVIRVFGERELDAALTKARQARDVFESVTQPLEGAKQAFTQLASQVQGAFIPALARAQDEAQSLASAFTADKFSAAQQTIASLTRRMNDLAQAQKLASSVPTGGELQFRDPGLNRSLTRASRAGTALMAVPSSPFSGGQDFSELASELNRVSSEAVVAKARFDGLQEIGAGWATQAGVEYRRVQDELDAVIAKVEKTVQAFKILEEEAALGPNLGASTQVDNLGNIGARTGIAGMGARTSILGMGLFSDIASGQMQERRRQAEAALNRGPQSATEVPRQMDGLLNSITAARSQLDTLPASVRSRFIPAIRQAEDEFINLSANGIAATSDQLDAAARRVDRLAQSIRRASSAESIPTFAAFTENISTRQAVGELTALQQILSNIQAQAGGPAAQAYDRYRERLQAAIATGTTGLPVVRRELEALQREAAQAASETGRISFGSALRGIQRGGDIGRAGFDNFSLAAQQAGFAIDDFLSSTGGFDQKLRAISNNVTQLAFILGGTQGLFIGLGAVIGGQLLGALVKWYNQGISNENQVQALNDALARQKSLVEELAQAFRSLGDAISRQAFSSPANDARAFAKELDTIAEKQKKLRESRAADLDPEVQRERARQQALEERLKTTTDAGQRVAIVRQIQASQQQEQQAASRAASRTISGREVADSLRRAIESLVRDSGAERTSGLFEQNRRRAAAAAAAVNTGTGIDAVRSQRAAVEAEINRLAPIAENAGLFNRAGTRAANAIEELQTVLNALDIPLTQALDQLTISIARASEAAASAIQSAQDDVADAIRRGVQGAAAFQSALDNTASQLDAAFKQLEDAQKLRDPTQRDTEVSRAGGMINDILMRRDAIAERARELRLGQTFGGDRTTSALSSLQGNARFANEAAGLTAVVAAAADRELEARRGVEQAIKDRVAAENSGNAALIQQMKAREEAARAELEAAQQAGEVAALMAEAALAMEEALSRLRKVVDDAVSVSESIANDAQSLLTNDPNDENRRFRDRSERQLISDRERAARAQNAIDARRAEAMSNPAVAAINSELAAIDQERRRLAADARTNGTTVDPREMQRLADREAALAAERERILLDLTSAERESADAIGQEIAARRKLIDQQLKEAQTQKDFEDRLKSRDNPLGDAARGGDLVQTDAQKAMQAVAQGIADINAYFGRLAEATNGLIDQQGRQDAIQRFAEQQQRAAAPAIFGMADQVMNAALQGPSRAALTAADVNTTQGNAELNRLLRGDDPNRNANIVELQKQNTTLVEINKGIQDVAKNMGIVVDL